MEEDTEYLKLPLEDRCVHKLWKARVNGYEECTKHFAKIAEEKSPEFTKFAPLVKKFVTDSNVVAQEKALDAVLCFVENAHPSISGRTVGDVIAGIVAKCLSASKKTTQEKALDVILMYCEAEKYEIVQEELIKGFSQKNPKVVCGCIRAISTALREFGNKIISIKPLVKNMGALLEDRDKNVREETKKMVIEMYRWVGQALKSQLTSLKPIQIQELEKEFEKMPKEKPVQIRFLRSQQELKAKVVNQEDEEEEEEEEGEDAGEEFDPLDLMAPVNILEKLPPNFYEQAEAKKWQERKEAMEALLPLSQSPKIEGGDLGDLVKVLKKIIGKDTNVMIIALAGQCMCGLAKGLKKKFSPYAISSLETIFDKFKEKKMNVVTALRDASDAVFQATNIEAIHEIASAALNNKNPNVKAETASFLARSFCYCTPVVFTKKLLKSYTTELIKTLNESDSTVRDNSAEALGTALKVVGEKAMGPFISDIDSLKMQKIKESCEKAVIKVKVKPVKSKPAPKAGTSQKNAGPKSGPKPVSKPTQSAVGKRPATAGHPRAKKPGETKGGGLHGREEDPPDAFDEDARSAITNGSDVDELDAAISDTVLRTNISAQITSNLISELGDKNWKARMEALGKVSSLLTDAKFIEADLGELPDALCPRLSDTNKNIAAETLKITSQLAASLGPQCKQHTRIIVPGILAALGDTKKSMRDQALNTLNDWVSQLGSPKDVIDGEMCIDSLKSGSPFLKAELISWMSSKLRDAPPKSLNKEELVGCIIYVYCGLEDRNADIRKASNEAILPFMLHLGFDAMVKHSSKVKPSSKNTVMQALEKAKPNLPARPVSGGGAPARGKAGSGSRPSPAAAEKEERAPAAAVSRGGARRVGGRVQSAAKGGASSRKEEAEDTSPLLQMNNLKQQRMTEEQRMRTLRWDFATPRPEFITQLKDQMTTANLNRQLFTNMFHQDFKFHIKAIDGLIENLTTDVDACIANLDLILRWLTIRFFDTNPSVILKAMDFLSNLFSLLSDNNYSLTDYEAYSFLPFLVMKFGDPKDAIRGPTKNIMKLICNIYPASKVSPYILDGLKSKNARQRAECLETIGSLIEDYGMIVCQPTPPAALKEVAKQIADRDNSVRNAALNCLLQVYFRQGEKVYKLIGQISDKDHSLLEERIKRSAKTKPIIKKPAAPETNLPAVRSAGASGAGSAVAAGVPGTVGSRLNRVIPTPAAQPSPVVRDGVPSAGGGFSNENTFLKRFSQRPLSGDMGNANSRLQIDYDYIEKLLQDDPLPKKYQLEEIPDLDSVLEYETPCPFPTSRLTRPGFTSAMKANVANANVDLEDTSQAINMVISQVATPDVNTVITALSQLDEVIQSDEKRSLLVSHIEQLLIVARFQYRHVLNTKMSDGTISKEECIRIYRSLTSCLMSIFHHKDLGTKASRDVLRDVMHAIISVLLDSRLSALEDGPRVVRALNVLAVRIIERAQFTNIFSALLKLLHESVGNSENPKFTDLVMRCNWKATRILSSKCKDLNPVSILQDIHDFMVAYPSKSWAERPSDIPQRTFKTVLHHLGKAFGNDLLTYLTQVPNTQGSEIQRYIMKNLNQKSSVSDSGDKDNNKQSGVQTNNETEATPSRPPRKLSKSANNTLSEIFKKIGSKENTKEGLVQLYEFKQKNPDADIDSYLRKSSQFFQDYIERGLKRVELERQGESKVEVNPCDGSTGSAPLSSIQVKDASRVNMNELVDQFKALAAQAGFDNTYIDSAVKEIYIEESKELKSTSSDIALGRNE